MEKPIGVGIIGITPGKGWAAVAHVPALRALPDYKLAALSTSRMESAIAAGAAFGVDAVFDNAGDLARHPDVDLVVVTVKVPHHFELVSAALDAGKMVYSEWPLGNGLDESIRMANRSAELGIRTVVGLQARLSATIRYVHDLVRDGYVGEVLSTSLIGSGMSWGAEMGSDFEYVADHRNGATMLSIPQSHTLDALCAVLGEFTEVSATQAQRRDRVALTGTDRVIDMTSPDQVAFSGVLSNGAVASVHYRGGQSLGTNLLWEINGSKGDLRLTADTGHGQFAAYTLEGGRVGGDSFGKLTVPEDYHSTIGVRGPAENVANVYAALARDLASGTHTAPDFAHAVVRHRMIDAIERSAREGVRVAL